jgi:hypothetical protein
MTVENMVELKSWMTGEIRRVSFTEVRRFGKWGRYGDNRDWTVAQLPDGTLWYSLYRDQTPEVRKLMKERLIGVHATGATVHFDAWAWELEDRSVSTLTDFPEVLRPLAQHRLLHDGSGAMAWAVRTKGTRLAYNDRIKEWLKSHGFSYWRCGEWILRDTSVKQ